MAVKCKTPLLLMMGERRPITMVRTYLAFFVFERGLCFLDVKTLQESFLLEWITKIYKASDNEKWSYIPSYELLQFGKEYAGLRSNVPWKKK